MDALSQESDQTRDEDLADWQAFCLAYYEPVVRALGRERVAGVDAEDLAHSFFVLASERHFLELFRAFRAREAEAGRQASMRNYLFRSLRNHVRDAQRRSKTRTGGQPLSPEAARSIAAAKVTALDPDAIFAIDVLHQSIQALRTHCERAGKPNVWIFFEELILADEFRDRHRQTRAELMAARGIDDPQIVDNTLTTAKRAFRRLVLEAIPTWPGDDLGPSTRFADWMDSLRESNASQFELLHLAYRVAPFLGADASQASSAALVVDVDHEAAPLGFDGGWPSEAVHDELSILLSFRLEMPLERMLEPSELARFLPTSGPGSPRSPRRIVTPRARDLRPLCLLSLVAPTEAEAAVLKGVDMVGLLGRLKSWAKQLRRRTDHTIPEAFADLIYTTVNVLALVRYRSTIHSIRSSSLASNVRWFLDQPWLDDRLRPLLEKGHAALKGDHDLECSPHAET